MGAQRPPPIRLVRLVTKALRPTVVIPLALSAAVLAALLAISNPAQVVAVMQRVQYRYLLYIFGLTVAYEALRCTQWSVLLRAMGIHVPVRTQVLSFLGGEVTETLPVGTYFRNYLLCRSEGTAFGLSSVATTLSIVSEVFICLAGLVILGLGAWSSWLRPIIVLGVAIFLVLVWAIRRSADRVAAPRWLSGRVGFQRVVHELEQFRTGAVALWHPRVLVVQSTLGALYLIVGGAALYLVVQGLGISHVTVWQALAVYFFSLAFHLISPTSMDIGVIELGGVAALVAVGVAEASAVGAMLIYRVLRIGFPLAIALVGLAILHDELRAALRETSDQVGA